VQTWPGAGVANKLEGEMQSIVSMDACSNGKPSLGASYPLLRTRLGPEPTRLSYHDKTKVGLGCPP